MFGAIGDSAPDRWGRALMRRMERRRAEREGGAPRTLQEIDFLLLVDDEARQGALRFAEKEGGPFLREEGVKRIPPLVELPKLLSAAEHVMEDKDTEEELRLLFAPGSSLGGARPKASVIEKDGHLAIAKFPRKDDEINTVVWEAVALSPREESGHTVSRDARVETIANKPVLLLRRFDRDGERRIPFLSAMSMLGSKDNETRSYLEIVDALRQHGAAPKADMEALWRRVVFNDPDLQHRRSPAQSRLSVRGPGGLAPVAGLRSQPGADRHQAAHSQHGDQRGRQHARPSTWPWRLRGISTSLTTARAREIAAQVGKATAQWRDEAARHGLSKAEIERMASAFEHKDLTQATGTK